MSATTRRALLAGLGALILPVRFAKAASVTDIVGQQVTLPSPVRRVLLGEGRFLAALAALDMRDPLDHVAGMLGEFAQYDPVGFSRWQTAFPAIDHVPTFGLTSEVSVSLEKAIALRPDVAVFGLEGHGPGAKSERIIEALHAAGIPVVFIDFRSDPLGNTAPSIRLLGQLLGRAEEAERFASRHEAEIATVVDRLAEAKPRQPSVLLEVHVGLRSFCCFTMARGSLADLIAAAGGQNIGRDVLPGATGPLNLEHVIAAEPEVYIGTAIGNSQAGELDGRIALGPGETEQSAHASLRQALDRPGVATLPAVQSGRAHGIWHHFYSSPLNAYALQSFAKWLHPSLFADLEPEATLDWMLARARPVSLQGTYAVSLEQG